MPRSPRVQFEGAWYHVMNRGAGEKRIYQNDRDRNLFLELLHDVTLRYQVQIHAYCLMDNHYHILLHTPYGNLAKAMQYLKSRYVVLHNYYHKTDGPLFRGRYRAVLVEEDKHYLCLHQYIHLNPVKAKMVQHPSEYIWSSYNMYLNENIRPQWLYCDEALKRLGSNDRLIKYINIIQDGIFKGIEPWPGIELG